MKFFIMLTKRRLIVITLAVIAALILFGSICSAVSGKIDGSTNALRVGYIKRLGYHIDETPLYTKEITVPQEFGEVYSQYNKIQKQSGFDLSDYKGKKATLYCYELSFDDGVNVNLIVLDGEIIGGDVSEIRLDGEMKPLVRNDSI